LQSKCGRAAFEAHVPFPMELEILARATKLRIFVVWKSFTFLNNKKAQTRSMHVSACFHNKF
jgi:hypothetical protein